MSRELAFLVYCMERYRHFKGLSGADVARLFDEHGVYRYIIKYFEHSIQWETLYRTGY